MSNLIKYLYLAILLSGCTAGTNKSTNSTNTQITPSTTSTSNNNLFTIGGTYDSMSVHPTDTKTCLKIGSDTSYIQLGIPQATLDFSSTVNSSTVQNALGTEYTATYGWGPFAVSTSYQYARSSKDDDFTLNMNYAYQYAGKAYFKAGALTQGNSALTSDALQLVESYPEEFRTMCGDRFVAETYAGVSVLMRVSLQFNSHNEKNVFDDSFHEAPGLANVLSIIESNTSGISYNLTVAGIQVGGNPQALNDLFLSYGGVIGDDGYPLLTCSSDGNNVDPNCMDMINQSIVYANSVTSQLKTIDDYYLYNPTSEPWEALGVHPGATDPDDETLEAMRDISIQFNSDQKSLDFLNNYLHMLNTFNMLSTTMNNDLSSLIGQYKQVMNIYYDPANMLYDCYDGYVSTQCVTIRDNIFKQRNSVLYDTRLNGLLTHLQYKQYTTDLLSSKNSFTVEECALSPISDESLSQYLINCGANVSGSLDSNLATTIKYDSVLNVLNVQNLNYTYPASGPYSLPLSFSYITSQALLPDTVDTKVWSNVFDVKVNGSDWGNTDLVIVNDYY